MKRTQIKDSLRNILKKWVAFLSICIIVFLGVGCYLWTGFAHTALEKAAADYYKKNNFADFEIIFSLGISKKNIEKIAAEDYVLYAEGVVQSEGKLGYGNDHKNITVLTLTENVNIANASEGRLPENDGECAIDASFAKKAGISVGDTVTVSTERDVLKTTTFTVVGLATHPSYIRNGTTTYLLVSPAAVDNDTMNGAFTTAVVLLDLPESARSLGEKYFVVTESAEAALRELSKELCGERTAEVTVTAANKIAEAEAEMNEKLADGEKQIADGRKTMNEELANGKKELDDAKKKIDDGKREIEENEKKLADGEKEFAEMKADAQSQIAEAEKKISDGWAAVEKGKKQLAESKDQLENAEIRITSSLEEVDRALELSATIRDAIYDAKDALRDGISGQITGAVFDATWDGAEEAYYIYKSAVIKAYTPVIEAEMNEESTKKLSEKAETAISAARQEFVDSVFVLSLMDWAETLLPDGDIKNAVLDAKDQIFGYVEDLAKAEAAKPVLDRASDMIEDGKIQLAEGEAELERSIVMLTDGEIELAEKKKLADVEFAKAEAQLSDGRKQLEEGRAELENGIAQYEEGLAKYEEEKAKAEQMLADAEAEFNTMKAEAEQKLADAKRQLDEMTDCNPYIQNRIINSGYVDVSSVAKAIGTASGAFASLFLIVGGLVCFSTMAIIVNEQKKLIGATKAFGFFGREVFAKYAIFGVSATALGLILGIIVSYLLEGMLLGSFNNSYAFGVAKSIIDVRTTVIVSVIAIALSVVTTYVSCRGVLKKPASALMNGSDDTRKKQKDAKEKARGTVFSRLIRRNMLSEITRVIVSVVIIIGCVGIIGVGFSLKYGMDGMMSRQLNDVVKYDYKISCPSLSDSEKDDLEAALDRSGVKYISVLEKGYPVTISGAGTAVNLISADNDKLGEFFTVSDADTGKPLSPSEDGIYMTKRMSEVYHIKAGDTITIYDYELNPHEIKVNGIFVNYFGRNAVMSRETGERLFGEKDNCYYVILDGAKEDEFISDLSKLGFDISFERSEASMSNTAAMRDILNTVILGLSFMAIFMMGIIMTNLTNIFVSKRLKDIAIMRINGFSMKETMMYLARETIITNLIGIASGVVVGSTVAYIIIRMMEQPDMMLARSFSIPAWIIAVVLTALASLVINAIAFRKTKKLSLTDAK